LNIEAAHLNQFGNDEKVEGRASNPVFHLNAGQVRTEPELASKGMYVGHDGLFTARLLIRVPLDEMDREQAARSARLAPPMFRSLVFI
jgi:hypothetical protein